MTYNKEPEGIAVVLSVVVLSALIGLILYVSNITFRITATNRAIGTSEVAFFAAESAAELTIYEIEKKDYSRPDLPQLTGQALDSISGATWAREVNIATTTPSVCSVTNPRPACSDSEGTIVTGNPLEVTLNNGQSFQLDLNIRGATYPDSIRVTWPGGSGTDVIIANNSGQTTETNSPIQIPSSGTLDPSDGYRIRINNNSGGTIVYNIQPQGSGNVDLPLGLNIDTSGTYRETVRSIKLTRPAWLIY